MLALLGTLIASYLKLNVGRTSIGNAERWCVNLPFSIYLVWLTVASLSGFLIALTRRDAGYLFVLVWSLIGIAVKQAKFPLVANSAWAASALAFALAVYSIIQRRR
jgi:hypothetical protein